MPNPYKHAAARGLTETQKAAIGRLVGTSLEQVCSARRLDAGAAGSDPGVLARKALDRRRRRAE